MIDVYAAAGTFSDTHRLAQDLARAVMRWEGVPDIPLFADNTAPFVRRPPRRRNRYRGRAQRLRARAGPHADRRSRPGHTSSGSSRS